MRIVCSQLQPRTDEPPDAFVAGHLAALEAHAPADLYVLPELWTVGYFEFDRYTKAAEDLDGPTISMLADAARHLGAHVHVGSIVERITDTRVANTSVVLDPHGELLASYRKIHVFGYQSREREIVQAGDALVVAEVGDLRLGLTVCYDLRFPELFRRLVDLGADAIAVPAAWPAARVEHWRTLARARAIENLTYIIACNAAGTSGGVALAGHSAIYGPWGETVAELDEAPGTLRAEIDPSTVRAARAEFPALDDRVDLPAAPA